MPAEAATRIFIIHFLKLEWEAPSDRPAGRNRLPALHLYDKFSDLHYQALWRTDSLYIKEYRIDGKDTVHKRVEQVNYIIGSGQHTNSHLQTVNGYVNQMPMTWYSKNKKWDLPPGFENGINTRFTRKIGLECMSCHNAYPEFVEGSENKFSRIPMGIDCERCHGPGSIHVAERSTGARVDTSRGPDYSIVNPARLPIDAQFDICQRCHLQGNAVLKEGRSFLDYRPGQKLSDVMSVFLPRYSNADDEFIMASHADRLKKSPCFIKSLQGAGNSNSARPYKNAMTCITCHNPHVSVKQTNRSVFNDACMNCHSKNVSQEKQLQAAHQKIGKWTDCVTCHMPLSGSSDIPHVTIHDHYIRRPVTDKQKQKIREFLGLYAINEKHPDALTMAKAYVNQYEKFEQERRYLDSALKFLKAVNNDRASLRTLVHIYFIRNEHTKVINAVNHIGEEKCIDSLLNKRSLQNEDAWAAYRIAESYLNARNVEKAILWFRHSVKLAPYQQDFKSKLGTTLAAEGKLEESANIFEALIAENPRYTSAYTNLGYIRLLQGFPAETKRLYRSGESLDPDNETLLMNIAAFYMHSKDNAQAKYYLQKVIKINPVNSRAKEALRNLN